MLFAENRNSDVSYEMQRRARISTVRLKSNNGTGTALDQSFTYQPVAVKYPRMYDVIFKVAEQATGIFHVIYYDLNADSPPSLHTK